MLDHNRMAFNPEEELRAFLAHNELTEDQIIKWFLMLPRDHQEAVLRGLWSEFKPETLIQSEKTQNARL